MKEEEKNKNMMTKSAIAKKVRLASIVLIICFYCLIASNRARDFRAESDRYVHNINSTIELIKYANNGIEQIKRERKTVDMVLDSLTFDDNGNPIENYVVVMYDERKVWYYYNSVEHRFEPPVPSEFYIYVDRESNDKYYDDLLKARKESISDYRDSIRDCIRQLRKMNLMPGWIAYILNPNSYNIIELFNYFN